MYLKRILIMSMRNLSKSTRKQNIMGSLSYKEYEQICASRVTFGLRFCLWTVNESFMGYEVTYAFTYSSFMSMVLSYEFTYELLMSSLMGQFVVYEFTNELYMSYELFMSYLCFTKELCS